MNGNWRATVEAWPYSTGNGAEKDKATVAPRVRQHEFYATDFVDAYKKTLIFQAGIKSHDKVWQAPVQKLEYLGS